MAAVRFLVSLVAVPSCAACARSCGWRAVLCDHCATALARSAPVHSVPPPGLHACWAVGSYDGVLQELVRALKFRQALPVAAVIAGAMSNAPAELLDGHLVPVPAAPRRRRWRGFDPAMQIAGALSNSVGMPLVDCLGRANGPRQVGRPRQARRLDPPDVRRTAPAPGSAVLVDDVMTTGATLAACARALRDAGSKRVSALTFAATTREVYPSSVRVLGELPKRA